MKKNYPVKVFPISLPATISIGDASIVLHKDGSLSGEKDKFLDALTNINDDEIGGNGIISMWLLVNAIRAAKTYDS